jgi:hypothetical protein
VHYQGIDPHTGLYHGRRKVEWAHCISGCFNVVEALVGLRTKFVHNELFVVDSMEVLLSFMEVLLMFLLWSN